MAKNYERNFVKLNIDGKDLDGCSIETGYEGWFEATGSTGLQMYSGPEGPEFDISSLYLVASKGTGTFIENYYKRGYKKIIITVVSRGSNEFSESFESLKVVYDGVEIRDILLKNDDTGMLLLCFSFIPQDTIEVTMNVINDKNEGLEKVGPITYSIPKKQLV